MATTLKDPLEHLVRVSPSSGAISDVLLLPCDYAGGSLRFRVRQPGPIEPTQIPAAVLESDSEVAIVYPPDPGLTEAFALQAQDPGAWTAPWSVRLSTRAITLSQAQGPEGEAVLSTLVNPGIKNARWRNTAALLYRLRWNNRDVSVLLAARVYGGLGRLATAIREESAGGPLLGVARGGLFSSLQSELSGARLVSALEALGLRYSAVANSELRHWQGLQLYRSSHPAGVQFLSANLVYSSATTQTLLPASAIIPVGGLRVAIVGLTHPSGSKYLNQAGLANATILDPREALDARIADLRRTADAVVVLMQSPNDMERLSTAPGVDLVIGLDASSPGASRPPESAAAQAGRPPFHPPLWVMRSYDPSFDWLEATVAARQGSTDWLLRERHRLLDAAVAEAEGYAEFDPRAFGIKLSTEPTLIASARRVFPDSAGESSFSARHFWTLAAGLAAEQTGSELGLLRVWPLIVNSPSDVNESIARLWLKTDEPAYTLIAKGKDLKPLLLQADAERVSEAKGLAPSGALRYTFGGVDTGYKIHGSPIDNDTQYRVVTTQVAADALGLSKDRTLNPVGRTISEIVLEGLRAHAGAPPASVRAWMEGEPIERNGLWTLNFRDVGLNLQQTRIVRDDAFNAVPNSRIQGFDELLIGGDVKADAEYLLQPLRWTNTAELEYARSRLRPRNQPAVANTTANRITLLTLGTWRAGLIHKEWLARQWGPSLGIQYDGQFEATPGLPRKQIYSALPGVSFFDGSWIKSLELSGNLKRDMSRSPPNTQTGLHARLLLSRDIGPSPVKLQGELYSNYFFLTRQDRPQDLRVEADLNVKLRVPIRKYLTVAPFLDFYCFALKTQPVWGYSSMLGVQIGFSRLWKPQYESLLGER